MAFANRIRDVGIGDIQVHDVLLRVKHPVAQAEVEPGDGHKIRVENGNETLLGRMRGLGGS